MRDAGGAEAGAISRSARTRARQCTLSTGAQHDQHGRGVAQRLQNELLELVPEVVVPRKRIGGLVVAHNRFKFGRHG